MKRSLERLYIHLEGTARDKQDSKHHEDGAAVTKCVAGDCGLSY